MSSRESWDDYFMMMACHVRTRATCPRRQVGCVVVDSTKRVKATGYNGAPPSLPHCTDVGCDMDGSTCKRTTHAEVNAITDADWTACIGGTIYTTDFPCANCADSIANSGLVEVVYMINYHTGQLDVTKLFAQEGIKVRRYIPTLLLTEG